MKIGLRTKLFLGAFVLIAICVIAIYGYARGGVMRVTQQQVRHDLGVRLDLVVAQAEAAELPFSEREAWDRLADRLGRAASCRVSFIARDGQVLGDSEVSGVELTRLENHLLRPEIQKALQGEVGETERLSNTSKHSMMYVARPFSIEGKGVGVARVALTVAQTEEVLSGLKGAFLRGLALSLGLALVFAVIASELTTRPLRQLTQVAGRLAAGNLSVRARVGGSEEYIALGNAFNRLAEHLSSTLGDLRQERDRMSGILSSMEEGVLFLDEERRVALVNPALRDMLLLQGDPTGRSLLEVVRHAELKEILDAARDDEEEEGGVVQGEIRVSGLKPRHLLVRAQKLEDLASGVVAVFLDVTEMRRLENLRREFVANVSHELRTPVTSVRSAAETLESVLVQRPEMAPRFVEIISRNAERLQSLVEDLLDLSRIESRQFSLTLTALSPDLVMAHVAELFAERAQRRALALEVEVEVELPPIRADRRALEHILTNLVDNAVKYAGEGRRVQLSARRQEDMVELSVSDNGPGIEPRHLPRLFERFYRVDAGRSRDLGGTGLGLSIVKHLVESMSGRVSVESEVGRGTTFRVRLPVASPSLFRD